MPESCGQESLPCTHESGFAVNNFIKSGQAVSVAVLHNSQCFFRMSDSLDIDLDPGTGCFVILQRANYFEPDLIAELFFFQTGNGLTFRGLLNSGVSPGIIKRKVSLTPTV